MVIHRQPKFAIAFGKPEELNIVGVEFDDKGNIKCPIKEKGKYGK